MAYSAADLGSRTIISSPTIVNGQEVTGESIASTNKLNTGFINNASQSLSAQGNVQRQSINTLLELSSSGINSMNEANRGISTVIDVMDSSSSNSPDSINNTLDLARVGLGVAQSAINGYGRVINPNSGGLPGLTMLASFLQCPEPTLLNNLINASGMLLNSLVNSAPIKMVTEAMTNLTKSILTSIPGTNYLLDFVTGVGNYLKTAGASISYVAGLVTGVLKGLGREIGYLTESNLLTGITSILDPSQTSGSTLLMNNVLPVALGRPSCSQLGKIINQIQSSYRSNNRFDDLYDSPYRSQVNDDRINRIIEFSTSTGISLLDRYRNTQIHNKNGYSSDTAISSSISTAIEVNQVLGSMETEFNSVNGDPARFEAVRINAKTNGDQLLSLMNATTTSLIGMNEGLNNIQRKSNFFDLGKLV